MNTDEQRSISPSPTERPSISPSLNILPRVTISAIRFRDQKTQDLFLAELMMFLAGRLEEYECEHFGM